MVDSLKRELNQCEYGDSFRFAKQIRAIEKISQSRTAKQARIEKLRREINNSKARCLIRESSIPAEISFPTELPVSGKVDEIVNLIQRHQVLVIAGETGSGKTTQIPKMCLNAGFGRRGIIGHTQPRRLAAVSVANRISEELEIDIGSGVGYQIRFDENISENTFLKLMTDGILLAEIQNDRFLTKYEVLIIDEAHERSLNIDFLLGYLFQLLKKRPELKLIITSATLDVEKFAEYFSNAPIVSIMGKTYPVQTIYRPPAQNNEDETLTDSILSVIDEIIGREPLSNKTAKDILVFLSSEREIRETAIVIRKRNLVSTEVVPLYSRLRNSEQAKVFSTHKGRRIILATNIAETSITVPGIGYVIDTGLVRISRYSIQSKVQRLPIESISQASANQRQGRCGRVSNGFCFRLYSESNFNARPLHTDPEITRTNLASVILQILDLKLGNAESFPYLDKPEKKAINDGFKLLIELNAITPKYVLTPIGKEMARLPVDPKLARMLVAANYHSCLREVLIIVSALSIQDPREISADNRQKAQEKLTPFYDKKSDFISLVNLWDDYELRRQTYSNSQLKKHCRTHFLSFVRMREWRDVHRQLLVTCNRLGYRLSDKPGGYKNIHKAIIVGSLNQIANKADDKFYHGTRNKKFTVFSSSAVKRAKSKWVVTGELIETKETFASMAADIKPEWVEAMAPHLVKREYFQPHWSKKKQAVMVYEKVYLYGLTIIENSLVQYKTINFEGAREIYICEGLVKREISSRIDFLTANEEFLDNLTREEEKLRKPELFIGDREIINFYKERIPSNICSTKDLEIWCYKASETEKATLYMTRDNILANGSAADYGQIYPDHAPVLRNELRIDYVFEPGSSRDGATIEVPYQILNQIEQIDIDWAIPGLIKEKCINLLKGLPKSLRKKLIPISGLVEEIMPLMSSTDGTLIESLILHVAANKKLHLSHENFNGIELPNYLKVKVKIIDDLGNELGYSENLEELHQKFLTDESTIGKESADNYSQSKGPIHPIQMDGLKDWEISELPVQLEVGKELVMIRYPAFVDKIDTVAIKLFSDSFEATSQNKRGLARLLMLRSIAQRNLLRKVFSNFLKEHALLIPTHMSNFLENAIFSCYFQAFKLDNNTPRNKQEFLKLLESGKQKLYRIGEEKTKLLGKILKSKFELKKRLLKINRNDLAYFITDIEEQLDNLVSNDIFLEGNIEYLEHYPRYFQAIKNRLDKAPHLGEKDKVHTELVLGYWRILEALRGEKIKANSREIIQFRWMLEEFRVSLFAQSLGTCMPVSIKRLEKQLSLING